MWPEILWHCIHALCEIHSCCQLSSIITLKFRLGNLTRPPYLPVRMQILFSMYMDKPVLCSFKISGFSDKDLDELRGIFTDTNLFLLGVTFGITVLHVCFTK